MSGILILYIALVGWRGVQLAQTGDPVAIGMAIALLVLPLVAVWALGREIWFGVRSERLGRRLESEGELPDDVVSLRPSGRIERADGDAVFPKYREAVAAHPDDWRAWYRVGLAYDAAGDRRRARAAVRRAISLESAERRSSGR